jgi:dihydrolipoamide dehydrogenase
LAIGDVTPGPALAHKAMAEAEVAARTAAGQRAVHDPECVPMVVYSDPEIVSVGQVSSPSLSTRRLPLRSSGRALTLGRHDGFVEVVSDAAGTVLGVHIVGPGVSELAGEAALAIEMAATIDDLALTVHPHPTLSEALRFGRSGA